VILIVVSACGRLSFDDAVGPVTVELHQGGDPVQGAEVVFQNADGTLAMVITTDVAGIATQDVARHSLVTVIRSRDTANGTNYDIETIVGLELNDRISRGPDFDPWFGAGDLVVSLPGSVTNATSYDIEHGCSIDTLDDPSMTDTKTRPTACAPIGGVAVLAIARDVDGNPLAFGDATDLTLVPGGAVMAPMSAWSTDWQPVQIGVSLAAGSAEASVHTEELQHGIAYAATDYGIPEVAPTVQVDAVRPKGFADAFGIEAVSAREVDRIELRHRSRGCVAAAGNRDGDRDGRSESPDRRGVTMVSTR
jgi:hypothetical protein